MLLILDGHLTHTRNLEAIELASKNHVTILVIPPHTSHRLQPLDVSFLCPLSTFYTQAVERFLKQNPGRVVTVYQLVRLFGEAYLKAASQTTAINGFKKCGISPVDKTVFSEHDFAPAQATERPQPGDQLVQSEHVRQLPAREESTSAGDGNELLTPVGTARRDPPAEGQCCGNEEDSDSSTSGSEDDDVSPAVTQSSKSFSPADIIPVPKGTERRSQRGRKRLGSVILTDSPYKKKLSDSLMGRRSPGNKKTGKTAKKNLLKKGAKSRDDTADTGGNDGEDAVKCLYCDESFGASVSGEGWACCNACKQWAHDECAGLDEHDLEFTCELCAK